MNLQILPIGFACLLMTSHPNPLFGNTNEVAAEVSRYTVKLRYEKEIRLSESTTQMLYSNAMQLVKTSNFNSRQSKTQGWAEYKTTSIQDEYRRAVSGKYLLLSFKEPQTINTVGGEISVRELVIGLNRPNNIVLESESSDRLSVDSA